MKKAFLLCFFLSLFVFLFAKNVRAEVSVPLYIVDYKSQVLFGNSYNPNGYNGVEVSGYKGLENYSTDYIGGYLHISYTLTHQNGVASTYPPNLYVSSDNPTIYSNTKRLYQSMAEMVNNNPSYQTNVYFVDFQFSATGYREVVTSGLDHLLFSDNTVDILNMDAKTFVSLVNNYPIYDPPFQYSMSFKPMRLESLPPTDIISFDVSTSTRSVTVHDYVRPEDVGDSINFNITTTSGQFYKSDEIIATTTGDFYYTWSYPQVSETKTGFENYTFYTDITKNSSVSFSKIYSEKINTPIAGYPGYSSQNDDTSVAVVSINHLIQTLGTGLSGILSRIDLKTINPSSGYYSYNPVIELYECNDDSYGSPYFNGVGCQQLYFGTSVDSSKQFASTQSFYPTQVVFNPVKYYFFAVRGDNQIFVASYFNGSSSDTVDGSCFQYGFSDKIEINPCKDVSDLYFRFYGVTKNVSLTNNYSNILFLPGIEASRLYKDRGVTCTFMCEDMLWEPNANSDVHDLYMNDDGTSKNPEIYTRDVLDEAYKDELGMLGPNIYKSFLAEMEKMKTDKVIADYSAVPYDWRLSLDDILNAGKKDGKNIYYTKVSDGEPYIISELRRLAESSKSGKVTIIAHSNGGLLTKALILKLTESNDPLLSKIDKIIFVAVPQAGTPMAIAALLHGYNQGIPPYINMFLADSNARDFAVNASPAYNLLPSYDYFTYVDTPVVTFDKKTLPDWIDKYGDIIHSQERLHNFLVDTFGRVGIGSDDVYKPVSLNNNLLTNAEKLHDVLDKWTAPPGVKVIEIAGWGVPDTMSGINYTKERCLWWTCGFLSMGVVAKPTWTIDGDGTVVAPSALWMGGDGVERYWVDLKKYNDDYWYKNAVGYLPFKHKDILEVGQLLTFINDVVTNQPLDVLPKYISTTTPIAGLFDTRLIYALHSQLLLNIYDDLGNHTGISTTTNKMEENILGTYFVTFGGTQYIFTTTPRKNNIVIGGVASTSQVSGNSNGNVVIPFTFEIQQFSGSSNIPVASTTFLDIPATSSTTATITFQNNDITSSSDLRVDTESDGTIDITLPPKIDDVVTFVQDNPATTTETTTPDNQNGSSDTNTTTCQIPPCDQTSQDTSTPPQDLDTINSPVTQVLGNGLIVVSVSQNSSNQDSVSNFVPDYGSSLGVSGNPISPSVVNPDLDLNSKPNPSPQVQISLSSSTPNYQLAQVSASSLGSYFFNLNGIQKLTLATVILLLLIAIIYLIR